MPNMRRTRTRKSGDPYYFEARGIAIDKFCVPILEKEHLAGVHGNGLTKVDPLLIGKWNDGWKKWVAAHPDADASQVYQNGLIMMERYGLADLPLVDY